MNFLSSFLMFAAENGAVDPNASAADIAGGNWLSMLVLIIPLGLMYVIMILPQKKKEKKLRETINSAIVGDQVITIGGIVGKIINIKDDEITFETSVERSKLTVKKWAIKDIIKPIEN
ncbi:MAG: preprotein translocase subunit YajC [Acetivibrionales bacterium]|jgi:preprotein translocase subunit YajC